MSSKFTSHASNFTESLKTGVDPRTGQFFMKFLLFSGQAHELLGPTLD